MVLFFVLKLGSLKIRGVQALGISQNSDGQKQQPPAHENSRRWFLEIGGPILGSLYEGAFCFGSIFVPLIYGNSQKASLVSSPGACLAATRSSAYGYPRHLNHYHSCWSPIIFSYIAIESYISNLPKTDRAIIEARRLGKERRTLFMLAASGDKFAVSKTQAIETPSSRAQRQRGVIAGL